MTAFFAAVFDRGLIAFDENLRLMLSPSLDGELSQRAVTENSCACEGEPLRLPQDAALPEMAFLAEHRRRIFRA